MNNDKTPKKKKKGGEKGGKEHTKVNTEVFYKLFEFFEYIEYKYTWTL